jgi:hypothetical protein
MGSALARVQQIGLCGITVIPRPPKRDANGAYSIGCIVRGDLERSFSADPCLSGCDKPPEQDEREIRTGGIPACGASVDAIT